MIKNSFWPAWTNIAFYRETTWYAPSKVEIDEMYFPVLKVQNAKHVVKEHLLAADRPTTDYYWIHGPHSIEYQQSLQTKIYCSFKFTLFPFDSNECDFVIRSGESRDAFLKLLPFEIHYDEKILVHGQEPIKIEQSVLPLGKGVSDLEMCTDYSSLS